MYCNNSNLNSTNDTTSNDDFIQMRNRSNTWPLQPIHAELSSYSLDYSTAGTPFYSQSSLFSEYNGSRDSGTASSSFSNVYYNNGNLSSSILQQQNTILKQNYNFFKHGNHLNASPANSPPNSPFSFPSTSMGTIDSGAQQSSISNFFALNELPSSSSHNSRSSLTEFNKTAKTEDGSVETGENEDLKKKRCRGKTEEVPKRKTNPWGEESYSELIEKALNSARDKKLKLNQIYDWFVNNLEYFRNRSNNEEGYGWKVVNLKLNWKTFKLINKCIFNEKF